MADSARPLYDCPEPCSCYAEEYFAGNDKAYFEALASLEGIPQPRIEVVSPARSCGPASGRSCTLIATGSPVLFQPVEA